MDARASCDRRSLLTACGIAPFALASLSSTQVAAPHMAIVIFDGREAISRHFAAAQLCLRIDVVTEQANHWASIRAVKTVDHVEGLTRWSEFLMARSFFEDLGLRVKTQAIRTNGLTHWHMA